MTAATHFPAAEDRVIFQPEFVEFGGEERVILTLARALHEQGRPHCVMCYRDGIDLTRHATSPLRVYQLRPGASPLARVHSLRLVLQRLGRMGAPVPALFGIQSAYHAGVAGASRYHLRIPDTYSLLSPPRASGWRDPQRYALWVRDWGTRRGIQRAESLITNTRALADELQALYGRQARVIYLGGHGRVRAEAPVRSMHPLELLSVSRLQPSKRVDWILRALAALPDDARMAPWRLHVVGTGPASEALQSLAAALGLSERVVFHGFVDDAQLDELYERCHLFLMPARQGYGLPALEALYRHSAVLMNVESGVHEVLADTPWVSVAPPGEAAFANALREMLQRITRPAFFDQPLPALPTMDDWAHGMIARLGW